ncbi:vacuolar amino acid transporter 1 isoform X2 [Amborella trichopoda]|uniref:vacuolar amino acid transporter 1 isoform X2 n=2 Tax=Amborella trichopoda TaxID=13333 RepID=UPI0009C16844|nr:vacuolar amino acid transporter 1 isoform X2 [Amborella trichopoda]|eukprot:XP_020525496.1 vacuolar amino acid transporter 1 isoform X2 [Amborella trichopoda]
MNKSSSERSLYIESDDEENDTEKLVVRGDGYDTDSSDSFSHGSPNHSKHPSSYNTSWPQSYRQSIDMYSSVASPNIGFLGTPNLSRLSSSYLSSSLQRRHTPEILTSLIKPLLPTKKEPSSPPQQQQVLPPPAPTKRVPSQKALAEQKPAKISHEVPLSRQCSFGQAVLNGMNVMCGVGILSTPFAIKEGGWMGIFVLIAFALIALYTGILLRDCLDSEPGLQTYPDIGQAAFGTIGRFAISIILYVELYACCVEFIILEGDNLSSLFPGAHLNLAGLQLNSHQLFAVVATLAVLPTVWLRDLSILSYISAGGVISSMLVVLCLFWVGVVDQVGLQYKPHALNLSSLPVAIGLYGYCYSGHAVFPNIYTSMKKPSQFPVVLITSFAICTAMYAGVAFMGYSMFGESIVSQFTLNMPHQLTASKIAVWTTVVNPFTKYALTLSPVALSLEELIPSMHLKSYFIAILIRTALVVSTLLVALSVPFFGLVMALIGSLLTMLVVLLCILILVIGIISSVVGTYTAVAGIIRSMC